MEKRTINLLSNLNEQALREILLSMDEDAVRTAMHSTLGIPLLGTASVEAVPTGPTIDELYFGSDTYGKSKSKYKLCFVDFNTPTWENFRQDLANPDLKMEEIDNGSNVYLKDLVQTIFNMDKGGANLATIYNRIRDEFQINSPVAAASIVLYLMH